MRNPTIKRNKPVAAGLLALLAAIVLLLGTATAATAQEQAADERARAQANNPLASMYALNFQNFFTTSLYGVPDRSANNLWIRAVFPVGRTLTRASLPLATRPQTATEAQSGLGDFNSFTAYLLVSNPTTSFGVGPLIVAPTATDDLLGQGKWQAGAAAVVFKATRLIQFGGLVTWQGSFAGDDDRESTSFLAVQPFAVWQLGGGTYLRSTSTWGFDLKSGDFAMPIGLGIGRVMKVGNTVYNMFLEPQFTFLHEGTGQPKVQIFAGIHFQFPK
jgi:hypothetical protein